MFSPGKKRDHHRKWLNLHVFIKDYYEKPFKISTVKVGKEHSNFNKKNSDFLPNI